MELSEKNKLQNTNTILTITVGFIVLFIIFKLKWMLLTALGIGIAGILSPLLGHYIAWVWSKFSDVLGLIMPNILLGVVYFVFLMPVAFLSRLGKHGDKLHLKAAGDTTFSNHAGNISPDSFEKTW